MLPHWSSYYSLSSQCLHPLVLTEWCITSDSCHHFSATVAFSLLTYIQVEEVGFVTYSFPMSLPNNISSYLFRILLSKGHAIQLFHLFLLISNWNRKLSLHPLLSLVIINYQHYQLKDVQGIYNCLATQFNYLILTGSTTPASAIHLTLTKVFKECILVIPIRPPHSSYSSTSPGTHITSLPHIFV